RHSRFKSPKYPHGQGFIAATSMNSEGKVTLPAARETVTFPSSIGCRITSSADRLNSGSSSRKRTPLCARLTSPGFGLVWSLLLDIGWRKIDRSASARPKIATVCDRGRHAVPALFHSGVWQPHDDNIGVAAGA